MVLKVIINIFTILAVHLLQVSFLNSLIYPLNYINIVLPAIFFIALQNDRVRIMYWYLITCFLLEYYSPYFLGAYSLSLLAVIISLIYFSTNFFSPKNLQGYLGLFFISAVEFRLILEGLAYTLGFVRIHSMYSFSLSGIFVQFFSILAFGFLIYTIFGKLSKKLGNYFTYS